MSTHRFAVAVGAPDVADVLHPRRGRPRPCVIGCRGMGASRDRDRYLRLGRELLSRLPHSD